MSDVSAFAQTIINAKYAHTLASGEQETWEGGIAPRVVTNVMNVVEAPAELISEITADVATKKFMPGGRYLYATGREFHQTQNCILLRARDSREGWAEHLSHSSMALMTGAGMGAVYSDLREEGAVIKRTGGISSGPLALMQMTNEISRGSRQGGDRRGAVWAGLHWWHKDVFKFIHMKDWSEEVRALKRKDSNFPATMDMTNISVILDTAFFKAFKDQSDPMHGWAQTVYWDVIGQMMSTGEPGFSVNVGADDGEDLRNACTEITSRDDSDICNLGSLNMARIDSIDEFKRLVWNGIAFLLAGTLYSDVPYAQVAVVRGKNRRLGLGLMGVHEWLLKRGKKYGPDRELEEYLKVYRDESVKAAEHYAKLWHVTTPIKVRAIAPTGTIGIAAETTTSGEPIFCVAYKRSYYDGEVLSYQYVIDPAAKRLIESGIDPELIEDAYSIDTERRVAFQAFLQQYVDHSISSTINLPSWGSETNNAGLISSFGVMLMKYLPQLRGITCYPDGARDGQPLKPVKYATAIKHVGQVFIESTDACDRFKAGSCGS
jgi:ribonucleoside-diphosphate reductase alpha chain